MGEGPQTIWDSHPTLPKRIDDDESCAEEFYCANVRHDGQREVKRTQ